MHGTILYYFFILSMPILISADEQIDYHAFDHALTTVQPLQDISSSSDIQSTLQKAVVDTTESRDVDFSFFNDFGIPTV